MFACLYARAASVDALVAIAQDFTPRFEVVGPMVMLEVGGLSRLLGPPREIGEQLRRACADRLPVRGRADGPARIAVAPTQTAAALLALGRAGLTVVLADDMRETLAALPVSVLEDFDRLRLAPGVAASAVPKVRGGWQTGDPRGTAGDRRDAPPVAVMFDALPYFPTSLERASDAARAAHGGGGWQHPRDSHAAAASRRLRRATETATSTAPIAPCAPAAPIAPAAPVSTLRRWGISTCGALAALPAGDVYERLGARGVSWQRLARGDDTGPLVPWVPEEPFEGTLDLEWPIEGLEPLSFVLGRMLEPLAERLARADRGAAVLHTHLRLVTKAVHARALELPAPMRDPKTLRTLILLDLESHPPPAAIDRVRVLVEPTPARVTQWRLFERAQPSPEQVSTLLARVSALMGPTHVGSPRVLDSWRSGVFAMEPFTLPRAGSPDPRPAIPAPASALRRFRLPVPARVQLHDGRPVRVTPDRRGLTGGPVLQAAGPWRTSGEWWNATAPVAPVHPRTAPVAPVHPRTAPAAPVHPRTAPHPSHLSHPSHPSHLSCWDRDEWDIALADGVVYRVFVERDVGQWFIEGVVD